MSPRVEQLTVRPPRAEPSAVLSGRRLARRVPFGWGTVPYSKRPVSARLGSGASKGEARVVVGGFCADGPAARRSVCGPAAWARFAPMPVPRSSPLHRNTNARPPRRLPKAIAATHPVNVLCEFVARQRLRRRLVEAASRSPPATVLAGLALSGSSAARQGRQRTRLRRRAGRACLLLNEDSECSRSRAALNGALRSDPRLWRRRACRPNRGPAAVRVAVSGDPDRLPRRLPARHS